MTERITILDAAGRIAGIEISGAGKTIAPGRNDPKKFRPSSKKNL